MVQGALKSTKSALAGGNRANGAGKKAALGPKKGQRVIKAKKDGLRRSEVLRKVSCFFVFLVVLWLHWEIREGGTGRNMMTHLHMHGFPSGLLERVETSLTSLSTCLISTLMIVVEDATTIGDKGEKNILKGIEKESQLIERP